MLGWILERTAFGARVTAILVLAACTARGPLLPVPEGAPPGETATVFEASNRAYRLYEEPHRGRLPENVYSRVELRIPTNHEPGTVQLPGKTADPEKDFLVAAAESLDGRAGLIAALRREMATLPRDEREVIVFTPGFNMSGAQSLVRMAQLKHDLDLPGIAALYSWPSAANILGYAYDRDSTLYSRDTHEAYLRALADSGPRRMILVAHSVGAFLTMETLRQIAISDPGWIGRNVGGVVLISPDIDVEVFRSQVARIGKLPQPFAIFVSETDRALALSARLTGEAGRLGTVTNPAELADLEVTLLDVTAFNSGIGHFTFGSLPALLSILSQLADVELSFDEDPAARTGLIPGTILTVQAATRIVLSPISQ